MIERPVSTDKLDIKISYDNKDAFNINNIGIIPLSIRLSQTNDFLKCFW